VEPEKPLRIVRRGGSSDFRSLFVHPDGEELPRYGGVPPWSQQKEEPVKFQLNYVALLEDLRKVGVGLVLAGLVGTLLKDVSSWVGLLGVLLGTVFILVGAFERAKEE